MKKIFIFFSVLVLMFSFALTASAANSITSRLKGKLLLQVQDKGRIWYVDPVGLQKHEVTFANALSLFQKLALGITNADLIKIPADLDSINSSQDSDGDGYTDRAELQGGFSPYIAGSNQGRFKTDNNLATKLKGRLLLQVQDKGRIWYIDQNGKRWEVTWGNLMSLFRKLALGITDKDLAGVGNVETAGWKTYKNENLGLEFKYPNSKTVAVNNNEIIISEGNLVWKMVIYENDNKYDLKSWFDFYFDKLKNKDCQELESNISIGAYRSKLFSLSSLEENCLDGGYYAISNDKLKVIKAMLGHDPGKNFIEILSTFKFTTNSSSNQPFESGDDINGTHIGYIKNISLQNNGAGSLTIDYVQWISPCPSEEDCPNGYKVVNSNPQLRDFPISNNVQIKLQTYSHDTIGNFNFNQSVTLPVFVNTFNNPTATYPAQNILYRISLKEGIVSDITEQYHP